MGRTSLVLLVSLLFIVVHDCVIAEADPESVLNAAAAVVEEGQHEVGDLVINDDGLWLVDYRHAAVVQQMLFVHLRDVVDDEDIPFLKEAGGHGVNVPEIVSKMFADLSIRPSAEEAESIIEEIRKSGPKLTTAIHDAVRERRRQPILIDILSRRIPDKYWKSADHSVASLKSEVSVLRVDLGWKNGAIHDFSGDPEKRKNAILKGTAVCRRSRVAYVFVVTISDGSPRYEQLCEELRQIHAEGRELILALADHEALKGDLCKTARVTLKAYAESMARRIRGLGGNDVT